MEITSSLTSVDKALELAAMERPGQPIRIRIQPAILRKPADRPASNFQAWKNLHWMVGVKDVSEGQLFREALSAFFQVTAEQGISVVHHALVGMIHSGQ